MGQLYVNNLTMGQLEDLLYSRLGRVYSGVTRSPNAGTHFTVTVSRIRSVQIYVTGSFLISAAATAMTAPLRRRRPQHQRFVPTGGDPARREAGGLARSI